MGVYIKGMEMPTGPVLFCIHPDGKVFADLEGNWREYKAVPVPKHGRLIDADALEDNNITYYALPVLKNVTDAAIREAELVIRLKDLDAAPTIIPASEEGE